ncbi:PREDICTED: ecto-NOX disulfide-thiol exchanger 2-like isoform X1 [Papilio xuthus]|uniref:Ecto-NOX disulfide-thiol exchanger 2-like isoform X1 n=2 Tax=Papilio xuthus TaxID=66420 RepID=A0AAJ6ZHA2_PAPXU|nr:PREDICTED: ecto-NOX disulfide-thiol exchanger 2-like isoform X1 [Papilio xuthus]
MSGSRTDRSRSPSRDNTARRRDKHQELNKSDMSSVMNQMMITNMYSQGNMLLGGGMYGNMIMPNAIMAGGMMQPAPMEIMTGTGLEMIPQPTMDMSVIGNQGLGASGTPIDMNMMNMGSVMVDPSMLPMYSNITTDVAQEKKEIVLKHCKLSPPVPGTPQPPRRERPLGCRTIFVGGLPDKIRESVLREIFEPYGRIQILRLSKKNFCHIRFDRESCVDAAMAISGYKVKLTTRDKDKDDKDIDQDDEHSHATNGWLHVDYALSRDDQNEYERRQRQAVRAQQAQMQLTSHPEANRAMTYKRSPSPVRIQQFTNAAIVQLSEKIKSEEYFSISLPTLIAWLERGECSKKYSNQFYTMIQATNSHIRRLYSEKIQSEEELQECKERTKRNIQNIIDQLEQVAKVFSAATHQRVWDHFTKPQRKNIETWQKMTQEFNNLKEEFNEKFQTEDMEYNGMCYNRISDNNSEEIQELKRENESLQFQLEAYKNEVDVIKMDAQKEMEKFKAQFIARQALQNAMDIVDQPPLPAPIIKPPPPPSLPDDGDTKVHLKGSIEAGCGEAKLIGVMSAFLQVHPQGASLDYVVSYVRALFPEVSQASVHHVLQKHEDVFQRTTSGVGANIEHRWSFVAFKCRK